MARAIVREGHGKLKGRHCVTVVADNPAPGWRGKGATPRKFMGCFKNKAKADARARSLSRKG